MIALNTPYLGVKRRLYHLVITKHSRRTPVASDSLKGVIDYLEYGTSAQIIYVKFHNDGKYNQLHIHAICTFPLKERYKNIKYPSYNIRWIPCRKINRTISYINQGHKGSQIRYWQEQIEDENHFRHFYVIQNHTSRPQKGAIHSGMVPPYVKPR